MSGKEYYRSSYVRQQSTGIEQVNTAVSQMDETTQQIVALVEEASAASENMLEQASGMNQMMTCFNLDGSSSMLTPVKTAKVRKARPRVAAAGRRAAPAKNASTAKAGDWKEF